MKKTIPIHHVRRLEMRIRALRRLLLRDCELLAVLELDAAWGEFSSAIDAEEIQPIAREHDSTIPRFRAHHHPNLFPPKDPSESEVKYVQR